MPQIFAEVETCLGRYAYDKNLQDSNQCWLEAQLVPFEYQLVLW